MTTGNSFISPQTPLSKTAVATTADVAWSAPVNVQTLVDDATNTGGALITSLYAIQRVALAGDLNCMIYKKVLTVYTLIDSAKMLNTTPSATVANAKIDFGYSYDNPLILEAGVGLAVAIGSTLANGVTFKAQGGYY